MGFLMHIEHTYHMICNTLLVALPESVCCLLVLASLVFAVPGTGVAFVGCTAWIGSVFFYLLFSFFKAF
jgi:hypothetical protein